jgi:filamentous hemagglutinin
MKLPNADKLVVEREKIADYLLNPAHRYGASKARFFTAFGFRLETWEILAAVLREHGRAHEVAHVRETGFGPRYVVEGELNTPVGRRPRVRTVWQMDKGAVAPRLISAYPLEEEL